MGDDCEENTAAALAGRIVGSGVYAAGMSDSLVLMTQVDNGET